MAVTIYTVELDGDMPNLANATPGFLIDEIGKLKVIEGMVEKLLKFHRAALDAQVPPGQAAEGELYMKAPIEVTQTKLDLEKVRAFLTPEQLAECSRTVTFFQTRFPKKG